MKMRLYYCLCCWLVSISVQTDSNGEFELNPILVVKIRSSLDCASTLTSALSGVVLGPGQVAQAPLPPVVVQAPQFSWLLIQAMQINDK